MDLIIQRASGGSVTVTVDSNAGTISSTEAAASAAAAAASANNAASSASSASSSATAAANSATGASGSATTATTQAGIATTQAATATTQANNAATSATNSANSATASANSATNATTSATNSAASAAASLVSANASSASATASAASATSAAASYDQFDDRYLGSKTTPPTVDNDGQPLLVGALYYNSVSNNMNVWTGTVWNAAYISAAGYAPLANPAFTGTVTENGSQIVVQTDIGTAPNEIPLNQYLGNLAYQNAANIAGDVGVGGSVTATSGVINANSTTNALRITQLGLGNALLVEDSANPDASPFVINTNGNTISGYTSSINTVAVTGNAVAPGIQQHAAEQGFSTSGLTSWASNAGISPNIVLSKSNSGTIGTRGAVANGTLLGAFVATGDDGTNFIRAASITAEVDGTPGTNDMPGRLAFLTTADGASTPTERMRIDSAGRVGIGASTVAGIFVNIGYTLTGATSVVNVRAIPTIASDVTSSAALFRTQPFTQAAAFTLGALTHFDATLGSIGATSAIANQYGFNAAASLIGATNNFGFHSAIPSGTGRWNFYAAGSAANYFAGDMQLDKTVTAGGTTGAQTINKNAGTVNFAAAASSLVVTDNRVTTSSIIICTVGTNDATLKSVAAVAGAGSFTLHANAAATAETRVNFLIIN